MDKVLLWEEKRILQAYHYFLDKEYGHVPDKGTHILLQNMVCLLQHRGWMRTEYEFFLTKDGMFSSGLAAALLRMDRKIDIVGVYADFDEIPLKDWRMLGSLRQWQRIEEHIPDKKEWAIALACVYYVSTVLLPACPFGVVAERVRQDITDKKVLGLLRDAWNTF